MALLDLQGMCVRPGDASRTCQNYSNLSVVMCTFPPPCSQLSIVVCD